MGWAEAELSITLLSDRAMAALNRRTFGRRGPTNVIAFPVDVDHEFWTGGEGVQSPPPSPTPPPPTPEFGTGFQPVHPHPRGLGGELEGKAGDLRSPGPPLEPITTTPPLILGEVVISVETTSRQAQEIGWPFEELFDFYLIHGILHLLGHDHDTPENEALMEAKSWELLEVVSRGLGEEA